MESYSDHAKAGTYVSAGEIPGLQYLSYLMLMKIPTSWTLNLNPTLIVIFQFSFFF